MVEIRLILNDIRSIYNVGSIFRTADGLGVKDIVLTGVTPYPTFEGDTRPPHVRRSVGSSIAKTALGAEKTIPFKYEENIKDTIVGARQDGYFICALEQTSNSQDIRDFKPPKKVALILGNEVNGMPDDAISLADQTLEIPMNGQKESFNVSIATAIAVYEIMNK